jgi:prophage regulatory protein
VKLISFNELAALGVPYSRCHLDRLQKAGLFPKKIKLRPGVQGTTRYRLDEVEAWLKKRCAERDAEAGGQAA